MGDTEQQQKHQISTATIIKMNQQNEIYLDEVFFSFVEIEEVKAQKRYTQWAGRPNNIISDYSIISFLKSTEFIGMNDGSVASVSGNWFNFFEFSEKKLNLILINMLLPPMLPPPPPLPQWNEWSHVNRFRTVCRSVVAQLLTLHLILMDHNPFALPRKIRGKVKKKY